MSSPPPEFPFPVAVPAAPPPLADDLEASLYEKHQKIYPREVHGWFATMRVTGAVGLLGLFYGVCWLNWDERQLLLFDLPARRFNVFWWTFYPQDFLYLALLLILAAPGPLLLNLAGRTAVVRLRVPPDRVHRGLPLDRAQDRGRPAAADEARPRALGRTEDRAQVRQARGVDRVLALDRLHLRRLLHPGHRAGRRAGAPGDRPVGDLLDPVLRIRDLRERGMAARAGVHLHVPLRALPERDVRSRHPRHLVRHRTRRAARVAQARRRPSRGRPRGLHQLHAVRAGLPDPASTSATVSSTSASPALRASTSATR